MGISKKYDDSTILARLDTLESGDAGQNTRLSLIETKNETQDGRFTTVESKNTTQDARLATAESNITDNYNLVQTLDSAMIDLNALNRSYLRREKSGSTTIPVGGAPVDIQYDYQVQANLKGLISTSDAITFKFNGSGIFLVNTIVSFTDVVMPDIGKGYCIVNMILGGGQKLRRLGGTHPNGNIGNISVCGTTVILASDGLTFKIQAVVDRQGTVLGHVPEARTYLEIFQL